MAMRLWPAGTNTVPPATAGDVNWLGRAPTWMRATSWPSATAGPTSSPEPVLKHHTVSTATTGGPAGAFGPRQTTENDGAGSTLRTTNPFVHGTNTNGSR